jgi:WD40 repeat protein/energy-coupling factor transporter ATP-binding protein EcfA2
LAAVNLGSTLELTIQRRLDGTWPVVVEHHRPGALLPVRSEGRLPLAGEPVYGTPRSYGTALGQALFRDAVRDAFVRARTQDSDDARVLIFIEAEDLKNWRWEWLCGPNDNGVWDFLSLDQRALFSLYLPSLTERAYPPIGRHDLRALVVVANPSDPKYGQLEPFDAQKNVTELQSVFGERLSAHVLARLPHTNGAPTLDEIVKRLTNGSGEGPYTILHIVCHGWVNPDKETILYLEQEDTDLGSGLPLAQPLTGTSLIERLGRVARLPHLVFLSACESSAPEAEQRLGGLAQRLVRELGIPAVIGMTEPITVATANALAQEFYRRLLAQTEEGVVDRALVEAYAGLAGRLDINVPALYSRLGSQPLFSMALDRQLTPGEIRAGLQQLEELLVDRAPVLRPRLAENAETLQRLLGTASDSSSPTQSEMKQVLAAINEICQEAVEISFHSLAQGNQPASFDSRQPFRGLSPFRAEDREFFFGREALVDKLEQKLQSDSFLPVLGPSGSGKSSLVLAGLVPRLQQKELGLQVIDDLTPGAAPVQQLKARQDKLGSGPVLYIVDQFEEVFTQCKDEGQRGQFINELLTLTETSRVVLTMRADFWGECARYEKLKDRMQSRQELVAPMKPSELRKAVELQAAKVGLRFVADLTNTMLDEVAGEPGAMPLLQHALLELWKRRHGRWLKVEEYRLLGGVSKAIAETADRLYEELTAAEQDLVRDIFLRLTQVDATTSALTERRDTRRRIPVSDLVPSGTEVAATKSLLKKLADAVLVVTSRNEVTGREEVEIAHEALIRYWKRLRKWLDEDYANLRRRDSITEAATNWEKSDRKEDYLLLRGSLLASARQIYGSARLRWSSLEDAYLEACEQRELDIRARGDLQKSRALARRLSDQAARLLSEGASMLELSMLVGLESIRRLPTMTAHRILTQGLERLSAQLPSIALPQVYKVNIDPPVLAWAAPDGVTLTDLVGANPEITIKRSEMITALEFSPNASFLLLWHDKQHIAVIDVTTGREILEWISPAFCAGRFSHDARLLLVLEESGRLQIFDLETRSLLKDTTNDAWSSATQLAFHGRFMAIQVAKDEEVSVWSLSRCEPISHLAPGELESMQFSPDGSRLLTVPTRGGQQQLWDTENGECVSSFEAHRWQINGVAFRPVIGHLATASSDRTARLWDANGVNVAILEHETEVFDVVWTSDGNYLATRERNGAAQLWDPLGRKLGSTPADDAWRDVLAVNVGRGARTVVTASDSAIERWRFGADTGAIALLDQKDPLLTSVAFSSDGRYLAALYGYHRLIVHDIRTKAMVNAFESAQDEEIYLISPSPEPRFFLLHGPKTFLVELPDFHVKRLSLEGLWEGVTWSRTGRLFAGICAGGAVQEGLTVWSITGDREIFTGETVWGTAISPDERTLATVGQDAPLKLIQLNDGSKRELAGHQGSTCSCAFSADGRWIASSGRDGTIRVWETATDKQVSVIRHGGGSVGGVLFSPNDNLLASVGEDRTVRAWDWRLGKEIFRGLHSAKVNVARFDSTGRYLSSGGDDQTARVWDIVTQEEVARFQHDEFVFDLNFSPDGNYVSTLSAYGSRRVGNLWLWNPAELARQVESRMRRSLTEDERIQFLNDDD